MTRPGIGRIVHYILTEKDAAAINRRRTDGPSIAARIKEDRWPLGAQAHFGPEARKGQHIAALVVGWTPAPGFGEAVDLQGFLVGNDQYWIPAATEGNIPGFWHWPEREA